MLFRHATSAARAAVRSPLAAGARFASTSAARPAAAPSSRWSTAAATVALAGTGLYFAAAPKLHLEGRVSYADRLARLPRNNEEVSKPNKTETEPAPESPKFSERVTIVSDGETDEIKVEGSDAEAVQDVAEAVVDAELLALTAEAETALGENDQSAAFDPRTGEINWDCPCLGGMAHGPCGEEFKLAFSCFVFSEAEPKGIDCVEKFQGMQTCFRKHPDVYAEEIADDEEASRAAALEAEAEAAVKA